MKDTINNRIMLLKNESGLTNLDFCHEANISHGTLNNIQNGENVSPKTIKTICEALNINKEWLTEGKGAKHNASKENNALNEKSNVAKALELLEEQLKKKDEQIAQLMKIFAKVNFLNAVEQNTGLTYLLPGQSFDSVRASA